MNDFSDYIARIRREERGRILGPLPMQNPRNVMKGGGWNGSGGGGGLACFDSEKAMLESLDQTKNIRADAIQDIRSWIVLDLFDYDGTPDWPQGDFDPNEFIRQRIRARLGRTLPVLATYLIQTFNETVTASWSDMIMNGVRADVGQMTSQKKQPRHCGYMQWALRQQNTTTKEPLVMYLINRKLDDHLRTILSPREYSIQFAVLGLHEAIYSLLQQDGHRDSASVRSLIDFILLPDDFYRKYLFTPSADAGFWSVWIREAFPILVRSARVYSDYSDSKLDSSSQRKEQWLGYRSFLEKMSFAIRTIAEGVQTGQLPQVHSVTTASPVYPAHNTIVFGMVFPIFGIDWEPPKNVRIKDLEAFYLVATELEANRKVESVQVLANEDRRDSEAWKKACHEVKTIEAVWRGQTSVEGVDPSLLGARKWVASKALRYCRDNQLFGNE